MRAPWRALLAALLVLEAAGMTMPPPPQRSALRHRKPFMMAKKPKKDHRVWLPQRSSRFAREVDVALQLVSRAAGAISDEASFAVASIAAQALVCDGIGSEFAEDTLIGPESGDT